MSIKFPPAILGPEMAAPILWAPGIFWFFLLENPHAHKIPPFRGVLGFFRRVGGSANFIFMGVGIFPKFRRVTIRGAQPSARLSVEIGLSEGSVGVSERAPRGLSEGSARSLRGAGGGTRDFPRVFGCSDPMLVTSGTVGRGCYPVELGLRQLGPPKIKKF